jgi:mannan endo-1,4-beta-mannosidase
MLTLSNRIHSDWDNFLPSAISQARNAGKKLIAEEWGSAVGSGRTANLQSNVQKLNSAGIPWLYWQLITNTDPHNGEDFEVFASALSSP